MSVTRSPRDIAFRLSEKSRAMSDGRRWEALTLPGLDPRAGGRAWFNLANSGGNRLIAKYLAEREARTNQRLGSAVVHAVSTMAGDHNGHGDS